MSRSGNELNMEAMNDIYWLLQVMPPIQCYVYNGIDIQSSIREMSSVVDKLNEIVDKYGYDLKRFNTSYYPVYDVHLDNLQNKYIKICLGVNRKSEHLRGLLPQLVELGVGHTGFLSILAEYVNYIENSKKELTKLEDYEK